jgi:hypothetical protein
MQREPPSRQQRVALAGVHVNVFIDVLTVTVDNVLTSEWAVLL